jgi:hypothetical protein
MDFAKLASGGFLVLSFLLTLAYQCPNRPEDLKLRALASIPENNRYNFSSLSGGSLSEAISEHLLNETTVSHQKGLVGIVIRSFQVSGASGHEQPVCGVYDFVRVKFEAAGVASSGAPPGIEILAPCRIESESSSLKTIWLPIADLLSKNPKVMDDLSYKFDEQTINITNIDGSWPESWELSELEIYSKTDSTKSLSVSFVDAKKRLTNSLGFEVPTTN